MSEPIKTGDRATILAGAVAGSDDLSGTLRRLDSKELAAWVDRGMALSENLAMYVQADCTLRESQARDMLRAHLFSAQPAPAAPTSPAKAAESVLEDAARLLALEAAANQIFNNPPSETSQDVRDVIEWFSGSIRVVLDAARKQGASHD